MTFHPRLFFGGVRVANLLLIIVFVMSIDVSELCVTSAALTVQFIFTSSCQQERSCLIYVSCGCLRIVVSNTLCVVFVFCLSSVCVPYLPVTLDCPFLIIPLVYLQRLLHLDTQTHNQVKKHILHCCSSYVVILFHVNLFFLLIS